MMTPQEEYIYDEIIELGIATEKEINLVKCVKGGFWEDVLNDIIYARTGYRSLDQMMDAMNEDDEDDED